MDDLRTDKSTLLSTHDTQGMLPVEETRRRVQQFLQVGMPVVITCAPLFPDKVCDWCVCVCVVWHVCVRVCECV
jgi:hypothetical protein